MYVPMHRRLCRGTREERVRRELIPCVIADLSSGSASKPSHTCRLGLWRCRWPTGSRCRRSSLLRHRRHFRPSTLFRHLWGSSDCPAGSPSSSNARKCWQQNSFRLSVFSLNFLIFPHSIYSPFAKCNSTFGSHTLEWFWYLTITIG